MKLLFNCWLGSIHNIRIVSCILALDFNNRVWNNSLTKDISREKHYLSGNFTFVQIKCLDEALAN